MSDGEMSSSTSLINTPGKEPFLASSIEENTITLRHRFQRMGYLYFRKYVSQPKCNNLLESIVNELVPVVTFDGDDHRPVLQGLPFYETDPTWDEVYPKLQSLESFHQFFHDEDIIELMERIIGNDVFVYPMKMGRIATPGKIGYETPPHQDAHSHQGGPTMAGIWVALHKVEESMGRLMMLPGSHTRGVRRVFEADGVGGVQCEILPSENTWHVADVEQGDVIIFHSCCVHKAEPNTSANLVRLSVDTRFCEYGEEVFITNFDPHHGWRIEGFDWQSIYKGWDDESLKYYWRDYPNVTSELRQQ